jgi:translocation and assembly module TamB
MLALDTLSYQAYQLDTLQINLQGNQDKIQNQLLAASDTLRFELHNWLSRDSLLTLGIDKFLLSSGQLTWQNQGKQARIFIDQDNYRIEDFLLSSAESTLEIAGSFSTSRADSLGLEITQFDLALLNPFSPGLPNLDGNLDFRADLNGDFANPKLESRLEIQDLSLDQISFNSLQLEADLRDQMLSAQFQVQKQASENFTGTALLPLQLDNPQQLIDPQKELSVKLALSELDLMFVEAFSEQIEKVGGRMEMDFTLSNTLRNPQLSGNLLLKEGYLNFPDYGLNYPKINLKLSFEERQIRFEQFMINSAEGQLQLQGWARLQQGFSSGIQDFDLQITAENFAAASREGLEILTNMQLGLQGDMQNPKYNGNLTIERARINLDTLPHSQTSQVDINEPLLVQASRSKQKPESKPSQPSAQKLDFLQQLQGSMRLQIPRNTWIRNKDLNVEISGDLQVVKNNSNFELFGSVSTLRGSYNLYGRKFDLSDGRVIFNGGKEINPILELSIRYVFRDQNKEKRELEIALSGNANSPSILFYLDGEELNEADAISYLLFGRSSDQITQNQRSEVASQNESSLASLLLARQIGGQLASEIGKTLNLDVVEFSGGDNWKEASVLVGKYITNDIFLSYEKEFSVGSTKNYAPDKISLEYEINRYLSLRATSGSEKATGIDLFWKYQKK